MGKLDFGPAKIRCNVVCPGGTRTEMLEISLGPLAEALGTDVATAIALDALEELLVPELVPLLKRHSVILGD